ncbi:uncharacterized protein LOC126904182 [Daktulosphaira vitifoliae]|uniref:uncharacterized protein LOC126904182 n=1 Tax=Daktulosphaira vitifoliae TaxID=58002 RepID=UPI0021A9DD5F|nr:uncharacterized protein LOC126904182 [Daktulosphaira vitifoliae]
MKAALLIASLFVAFVALEATTPRKFFGDNSRRNIYGYDDSSELMQVSGNGFLDINDPEANYYYNKFNNKNSYQNGWAFEFDELNSSDESSEQFKHINNVETFQPGTVSRGIVEKIAAIDRIFTKEQQLTNNLGINEFKTPLNVRNVHIKNPQREVITFKNAQINNFENGHLKHLVIDSVRDTLYVQYNFDQLKTEGSFKIGSSNFQQGDFVVELNKVRSNVTEKMSNGKTLYRPAKFEYANVVATNEQGHEVESLYEQFDRKYFNVLERTIADEVHNSVHKGLLLKLKNEINTPINNIQTGQYSKLFDLKWQENMNALEMYNIGSKHWHHGDRQMDLISYTRLDSTTYKLRFNTVLNNIQWTGDLKTMFTGEQQALFKSSSFKVDQIRIDVSIRKNIYNQQCGKVNVDVDINGFNYLPNVQLSSPVLMMVSRQLPRFMEHALEASMEKSLEQEICFNQKW